MRAILLLCPLALASAATNLPSNPLTTRGGAAVKGMKQPYTKKVFTAGSALADHLTIMLQLPKIMDAYVGPNGSRRCT